MAHLTISEAIRRSPIGKSQFYAKYIDGGVITVSVNNSGKKYIDSSELLRVFGSLSGKSSDAVHTGNPESDKTEQSEIIELLKKQVSELKSEASKRELETTKREEHYRAHIDALTLRIEAPKPVKRESWFSRFWNAKDDE